MTNIRDNLLRINYNLSGKNKLNRVNSSMCRYVGLEDHALRAERVRLWGKRGEYENVLSSPVVGVIVLLIFAFSMGAYVYQQAYGAATWEDISVKELTTILNSAKPGDSFILDVQRATEVAEKYHVSFDELFSFTDQTVCVKLSSGRKTCQRYFNAVNVDGVKLRLGVPGNVLEFHVSGKEVKQ